MPNGMLGMGIADMPLVAAAPCAAHVKDAARRVVGAAASGVCGDTLLVIERPLKNLALSGLGGLLLWPPFPTTQEGGRSERCG
eukprot:scaffold54682_cov31-Tisochrysis_lutea.AAC.2